MTYSYSNSYDTPAEAFEKGYGYCWHQASALNTILSQLDINSRLVHAFRNRIPDTVREGVTIKSFVSGHMWCRVTIDGVEKDVCPGHPDNRPGIIHFKPLSPVRNWGPIIAWFAYYGSAAVNARRLKKFERLKALQASKWNPDLCPCKKKNCPRYKDCEACRAHHAKNGGQPYCERLITVSEKMEN
jgi:hypothetical protein